MTVICPPLEEYEQAAMPPAAGGDFSRSRQIKGVSLAFLRSLECISVGSSSRTTIPLNDDSTALAFHPRILFSPVTAYGFGRLIQPVPVFRQGQNVAC